MNQNRKGLPGADPGRADGPRHALGPAWSGQVRRGPPVAQRCAGISFATRLVETVVRLDGTAGLAAPGTTRPDPDADTDTSATGGDLDVPAAHAASASLPAARCPTVTLRYTESAPIVVQGFDHEPEVSVFGPRPDRGRGPEGLRDTYGEGQVDARERGTTSV